MNRFRTALLATGVALATASAFAPALRNEFVNFDDDRYVTANTVVQQGLTAQGLRWACTSFHASNWHPLTWLTHMLDVELFGLEPAGHHGTSVILHAVGAALLFLFLARTTARPWTSLFATLFFALHPLRVESVAWVAERKDVLSGVFFFALLLAWTAWTMKGGARRYLLALFLFALGLLSKPMLVTAPFVLLLLDRWPLARKKRLFPLVVEKLPLFLLAAFSCAMTFLAQRSSGAMELAHVSPLVRAENALASIGTYVRQTVWPAHLSPFVPHAVLTEPDPVRALLVPALVGGALVLIITFFALANRRRGAYGLVSWLWALGMLVPVLGLVQVGFQAHADRYTYLPSVGLSVALAFLVADRVRAEKIVRTTAIALSFVVLGLLALRTTRQIEVWKDSERLWRSALEHTEKNFLAHNNLGNLLARARRWPEAREQYEASLAIHPGSPPRDPGAATVRYNLAGIQAEQGLFAEAARELRSCIALQEDHTDAHAQLGRILIELGDDAGAVEHLRRALELESDRPEVMERLAWVLATSRAEDLRRGDEAVELARKACQAVGFSQATFLETLAAAQAEAGDFAKAVRWQSDALKLLPPAARPAAESRLQLYRAHRPYRRR